MRQIAFPPGEGRSSWSSGCPSWRTSAGIFIGRGLRNTSAPESVTDLAAMAAMINEAHTVAIFGGDGCSEAQAETRSLAKKLKAPVGYPLTGTRWLEHDNPKAVGMTGLLGYGGCGGRAIMRSKAAIAHAAETTIRPG